VGNLTDNGSTWPAQVRELETSDLVLGGPSGASNGPLQDLANRTAYLKTQVDGKALLVHGHAQSDVTGLGDALAGKSAIGHTHPESDVVGLVNDLANKTPYGHQHQAADVQGLQASLSGLAPLSHTHSIAQVTNLQTTLNGYAPLSHAHAIADVNGLSVALASYQQSATAINTGNIAAQAVAYAASAGNVAWGNVYGRPSALSGFANDMGYLTQGVPTGTILPYSGVSAPYGYLFCDGSAIPRSAYGVLFGVISTRYGAGDGSTTFNVPDLRGRMPIGSQSGTFSLGAVGGEINHTLSVAELPAHTHGSRYDQRTPNMVDTICSGSEIGGAPVPGDIYSEWDFPTTSTGGNQPHNNMPPYLTINFIIKV
jgi:microcystin-dependent protein